MEPRISRLPGRSSFGKRLDGFTSLCLVRREMILTVHSTYSILGQGGYGIAALFELKNETTGAAERIVVKFDSHEGGPTDSRERNFLKVQSSSTR